MKPAKVSAGQAEKYYYTSDPVFSLDEQRWTGKGAAALGLAGKAIDGGDFKLLLHGYSPQGDHLCGKANHVDNAATDTPLSVPKSVSIMMLKDERLKGALLAAAEKTAASMEERGLIIGRRTENGVTTEIQGGGIFALFGHGVSRDGDPHAHTHLVAMNTVRLPDGSYSTLENRLIVQNQKETHQIFTGELASQVAGLGYSLHQVQTKAGVSFEITGVTTEESQVLSARNAAIRNAAELRADLKERMPSASDSVIDNMVQQQTRKNKDRNATLEDIKGMADSKLATIGSSLDSIAERVQSISQERQQPLTAADAIRAAVSDLTAKESVVTGREILHTATGYAVGHAGRDELMQAWKEVQKEVISYGQDKFTTPEMRDMQLGMAKEIIQGAGTFEPVRTAAEAAAITADYNATAKFALTSGQQTAVESILTNTDKMLLIQGVAGAGKSTMLNLVRQNVGEDVRLIGLAPTGKAAVELQGSSGIESQTVASFIQSGEVQPGQRTVIIVDEAGMLETRQWAALMEKASGAQIIGVGDTEQFAAIGAGKEFRDWQQHGMSQIVRMDESVRQRTDYAKAVAQAAQAGNFVEALEIMREAGKLHVSSKDEAVQAMAERIATGAENTVFSAMSNATRVDIINAADVMRTDREGVTVKSATPVSLDESAKRYAGSYKVGNSILITGELDGHKKGERLEIVATDLEQNTITAKGAAGQEHIFNAFQDGGKLSQYAVSEQSYHVGDRVAYTKNINTQAGTELKIKNSMTGTVKSIDQEAGTFVVENDGGKITQHRDGDFISRADCLTTYKTQGMTEQTAVAGIFSGDHVSTNALYVALTRQSHNFELFTDNPAALVDRLAEQHKTSVLDHEGVTVETMKLEAQEARLAAQPEREYHPWDALIDRKQGQEQDKQDDRQHDRQDQDDKQQDQGHNQERQQEQFQERQRDIELSL